MARERRKREARSAENTFVSEGYDKALLLSGGIIKGVGDEREMRESAASGNHPVDNGELLEIKLNGQTVLPGFFDAHMHFYQMAAGLSALSLSDARSLANALTETREFIADNPGRTAYPARQFDESRWPEGRFPTREELDGVCSEKPLLWRRICGHVAVVNSAALRALAELTKSGNRNEEAGFRDGCDHTSTFSGSEADGGM